MVTRGEGWRRQWHPTPVLLPGKSHGQRSLEGCSPWGCWESDTTGWLHFHFSLSCIGEGNGNPLQCSCLENPRDRGAWWAAVYGVTQNQTRLKQFSSSSSSRNEGGINWEIGINILIFAVVVQSLSSAELFMTNGLQHTISQSLLKHQSLESMMPHYYI